MTAISVLKIMNNQINMLPNLTNMIRFGPELNIQNGEILLCESVVVFFQYIFKIVIVVWWGRNKYMCRPSPKGL